MKLHAYETKALSIVIVLGFLPRCASGNSAAASANRSTACCNARMAVWRGSHRWDPLIERDRALELLSMPAKPSGGPHRHTAPTARPPPMLNSARRHCSSPRRGRRVERSDQRRPGIERLHFRARRSCRRCASDASYESVGNAGSIDVTTTDKSLVTDSV